MDSIVSTIVSAFITDGISATKYIVPQNADISNPDYSVVVVNTISDDGRSTKDTDGVADRTYVIRVDIFTKSASNKDGVFWDVSDSMRSISSMKISYGGKVDLYDDQADMYQQTIEYEVKL
jgi:hypothetical protein